MSFASGVAYGQQVDVESAARETYQRGTEALRDRRFDDAVRVFEESYRLRRVPVVLYNLGLAHRELGHTRAAIESFERYLVDERTFPPGRDAAVREAVRELRARLVTVALVVTPTPFTLTVDGQVAVLAQGSVVLDPGTHELAVTVPGYAPWRVTLRLEPGQRVEHLVTLTRDVTPAATNPAPTNPAPTVPRPGPHPATEVATPITSRWWFWAGLGAVAVGGGVAAVMIARDNAQPGPWEPGTSFNVLTVRLE